LGVPLISKGNPIGVIQVVDTVPGVFDETHQTLLEWLAASAAIAIENARLYERAREEIAQKEKAKAELDETIQTLNRTLNGTIQAIAYDCGDKGPLYGRPSASGRLTGPGHRQEAGAHGRGHRSPSHLRADS
jgi:hypothetical protein